MIFTLLTGASYFHALFPTSLLANVKKLTAGFVAGYAILVLFTLPRFFGVRQSISNCAAFGHRSSALRVGSRVPQA